MKTKDMTFIAVSVSILVVAQLSFSMVSGINLVFPLILIFTYNLGLEKGTAITLIFIVLRGLTGIPLLTVILWLWTYPFLLVLAYLSRKIFGTNEYVAAIVTALYFMLFGFLCALQEYVLTQTSIWIYWTNGVTSDSSGAIIGFITTLALLKPISSVIKQFYYSKDKGLT